MKGNTLSLLKKLLFGLTLMICICMTHGMNANVLAANDIAPEMIAKKTRILQYYNDDLEKVFTIKENDEANILYCTFDMTVNEKDDYYLNGKQGIVLQLTGYKNRSSAYMSRPIFKDSFKIKIPKNYNRYEAFYYTDKPLQPGYYILELSRISSANTAIKVTCEAWRYGNYATNVKLPKTITVKTDDYKEMNFNNVEPKGALLGISISTSNENIAEVETDGRGDVFVYGNKAGKCKLIVELANGKKLRTNIVVTNPPPKLNYTSCTMCTTDIINLELKYVNKKKVSWSSSNTKIATVDKNGKVVAKGIGKCYITAKYQGKTYKTTINVEVQEPNFNCWIDDYNTRNNYFNVIFYNYSNKPVTVYAKNAKVCNYDYKTYDRSLRFSKYASSVTIKPKQKRGVYFYVKGDITWYDHTDYWLDFYFSFDGKQYHGQADSKDAVYQKGSKWYTTYWE